MVSVKVPGGRWDALCEEVLLKTGGEAVALVVLKSGGDSGFSVSMVADPDPTAVARVSRILSTTFRAVADEIWRGGS